MANPELEVTVLMPAEKFRLHSLSIKLGDSLATLIDDAELQLVARQAVRLFGFEVEAVDNLSVYKSKLITQPLVRVEGFNKEEEWFIIPKKASRTS